MNYETLEKYIDDCIQNSSQEDFYNQYKAVILSSLSASASDESKEEIRETITMWQNQIDEGYSQMLFGNRYLSIQSVVLELMKLIIEKGTLRKIIEKLSGPSQEIISIEDVYDTLKTIISCMKKLEGEDICVAYQVVKRIGYIRDFTISDIYETLPLEDNSVCNLMQTSVYEECEFYNHEDNICTIRSENKVEAAVESLLKKKVLVKSSDNTYDLKW